MELRLSEFPDLSIRRQAGGYCIEGPGFYLWGEDAREVSETARDLLRGPRFARPSTSPALPPGSED